MAVVLPFLLIFLAGVLIPPAVALNTALSKLLNSPLVAAFAVMAVGAIYMAVVSLALRARMPTADEVTATPWYVWIGGSMIATYMIVMNYNVPKVGVGIATSLVVAGQLMIGLIIDHFGLFGLPQASFSFGRFAGVVAVIAGVLLLKFF